MATKIYVGGLAYETTEDELKAHFANYGEVQSATIINDQKTGRPKGIGFIEMPSSEEAQKAITALNTKELGGRRLTVNQAKPHENRSYI